MRKGESTPAKVVVTADDFGLSKKVNEGILVAFREGVVRNTGLMVNFPDVEESVACLQGAEGLDVGIHLNLTSGPPVLEAERVASLIDNGGTFPGLRAFLARAAAGRIDWTQVRQEWQAQIERGLQLGCHFTSISSHQHIHMLPQSIRLTAMLARKYSIPFVRLSRYHRASMFSPLRVKAFPLLPAAMLAQRVLGVQCICHNDYMLDMPLLREDLALVQLTHTLKRLPGGIFELVCHPGYVDATLQSRDQFTLQRLVDLNVLTASKIHGVFQEDGVDLTTYRILIANGAGCESA